MEKREELVNPSTKSMERFISDDMVEMRHKIGNSFDLVELDILEVCDLHFLKTVRLHISLFYIGLCKARGGCLSLSLSLSLCLFVCFLVCVACLLAYYLSLSRSLSGEFAGSKFAATLSLCNVCIS
jgi:hypothetical protein